MLKILVPVDGSDNADRAAAHAAQLAKGSTSAQVHLLNVQTPPLRRASVSRIINQSMIDDYYARAGETSLEHARELLEKAGVPYVMKIEFGHTASQVIDYAKANNCDRIVMGTRGNGAVLNMLIGSVANQVLHLAEVPVTLIK